MFSKFFNIDTEKQERIINAASKEFALKGYEKASTNEMVKEAGISKGLLFHYFSNKKDLYLFLYDHFADVLVNELFSKIDWDEKDIFNKFKQVTLLKFEVFKKYPEMFDFLLGAVQENSNEVKKGLEDRNQGIIASSYQRLLSDIDLSKFKDGLDIEKAINIIFWTLEGFSNQKQQLLKVLPTDEVFSEEVLKEMDSYLEILKKNFYK